MRWNNREIAQIPRNGNFPFRVCMLFFCEDVNERKCLANIPEDMFEFSLRLSSGDKICHDIINGQEISEPFPHFVWKKPGQRQILFMGNGRETISFAYRRETMEAFRYLGLQPEWTSKAFYLTSEIKRLIVQFRQLCRQLYSPGTADQIDWTCFQLYREIFFSHAGKSTADITEHERIRNISVWFQLHYHETIDLNEIARANGFSRATFFRKWKEVFPHTPTQYILTLRLEAAAKLLLETDLPIHAIVREVRFSGPTAFHRCFLNHFGMTPNRYRKHMTSGSRVS